MQTYTWTEEGKGGADKLTKVSCIPNEDSNTGIILIKQNTGNVKTLILLHLTWWVYPWLQPVCEIQGGNLKQSGYEGVGGWSPRSQHPNNPKCTTASYSQAVRMHLREAQRGHVTWTAPEMSWGKPRLSSSLPSFNGHATQPLTAVKFLWRTTTLATAVAAKTRE